MMEGITLKMFAGKCAYFLTFFCSYSKIDKFGCAVTIRKKNPFISLNLSLIFPYI